LDVTPPLKNLVTIFSTLDASVLQKVRIGSSYGFNIPVQERSSTGGNLLLSQVLVEKHRRVGNWPREVDILAQSFRSRDTVLKCAFIEHVGREFGKAWMHSILNLETNRAVAKDD